MPCSNFTLQKIYVLLISSVGLVSIFGFYDDEETRFPNFKSTFKRLFWIIFDPGQEELTDIGPEDDAPNCFGINATKAPKVPLARPLPGKTGGIFATSNPDTSTDISHNIGIYIWAFYQVI